MATTLGDAMLLTCALACEPPGWASRRLAPRLRVRPGRLPTVSVASRRASWRGRGARFLRGRQRAVERRAAARARAGKRGGPSVAGRLARGPFGSLCGGEVREGAASWLVRCAGFAHQANGHSPRDIGDGAAIRMSRDGPDRGSGEAFRGRAARAAPGLERCPLQLSSRRRASRGAGPEDPAGAPFAGADRASARGDGRRAKP